MLRTRHKNADTVRQPPIDSFESRGVPSRRRQFPSPSTYEARLIPTPEQLQELSQAPEGKLPDVPFAALLLGLSIASRTLVVEVRRKQISKRIAFEMGVPIDCRSNLVHETLGRYMVAEGKIQAADLHSYLSQSAGRGQPLGEILLDHGMVTAEELYKLLQQNLAKK